MNTYRLVLRFRYVSEENFYLFEETTKEIIFNTDSELPLLFGLHNRYFLENKLTGIQEKCLKSILDIRSTDTISSVWPNLFSFNFYTFTLPKRNW